MLEKRGRVVENARKVDVWGTQLHWGKEVVLESETMYLNNGLNM